jgi:DNA processing protein
MADTKKDKESIYATTGVEVLAPADILGTLNDVEAKNAPAKLFLRGDTALLRRSPRVAIVGSRDASVEGLKRARSLAGVLVNHQMIVVSGLAAGIDTAAHRGAIDAGGRTIAVLGTPVDETYPRENAELQHFIASEHLVASQFPMGQTTTPKSFPMRNRTMALLTDATVIVEASEKSGTVHQGWEALRLGRKLFLLDSVANNSTLSWPREMISYGAEVLSRENLEESLADLPVVTGSHLMSYAELA